MKNIYIGIIFALALVVPFKALAISPDVAIDEPSLTCGTQEVTISGTSSFDGSVQTLVRLFAWGEGEDEYLAEYDYTDGAWAFDTQTLNPGDYYVYAAVLDDVCTSEAEDINTCILADAEMGFGINECEVTPIPDPTPIVPATVESKDHQACMDTKPLIPTWSKMENGTLLWSATGGSKVELRFGYLPDSLIYKMMLTNDGHEKVGIGTEIGWWGGYWKLRTINGCNKGDWSPLYFSNTF